MKILSRLLIGISILSLFYFPFSHVYGASFDNVQLRLNRLKANTALSGYLCVTPSTSLAGTEAKVAITFPTDFTISPTSIDWTTGSDNLPSGATAWPGISTTATTVTGQTVTFSSNDLISDSANYCFSFIGTSSTTGAIGTKTGSVATYTNTDSLIDETSYYVSISSNDQVALTATVPANPDDFSAILTAVPTSTTVQQDQVITYTLTYGSTLATSTNITLEADWTLGTIEGSSTPTVEVLQYVSGSASNAYNGTQPVIDLVNRKITWTITSFPANTTNETVTFQLLTTTNFTQDKNVTFQANGRLITADTATPDSTVAKTYRYVQGPTPTATQQTTTPGTPTPTTIPKPFAFQIIDLRNLTATQASVFVTITKPGKVTMRYGTEQKSLNTTLISAQSGTAHLFKLTGLTPGTTYFFQLYATDTTNKRITSDLYTFTTPSVTTVAPGLRSFVIISRNSVLYDAFIEGNIRSFPLPVAIPLDMHFTFKNPEKIKHIQAFIRRDGLENITRTQTIHLRSGIYAGRLFSPEAKGMYQLVLRYTDYFGNIIEEDISTLYAVTPFTVQEAHTQRGIEGAKVHLTVFDPSTKLYQDLSQEIVAIANPAYSNYAGIVPFVLPKGNYKAEIFATGYETKEIRFRIGDSEKESYPTVTLKRYPFSIITFLKTIGETVASLTDAQTPFLSELGLSGRFIRLLTLITLLSSVLLTILAFSSRFHFSYNNFHSFLTSYKQFLFGAKKPEVLTIHGTVTNEAHTPLYGVSISVLDSITEKVLATTYTTSTGKYEIHMNTTSSLLITYLKNGYVPHTLPLETTGDTTEIILHESAEKLPFMKSAKLFLHSLFTTSFELLLVGSLLLELVIGFLSSWTIVIPFLVISACNVIVFALHEHFLRFTKKPIIVE